MDADTRALLQEVSREIAAGVARLVPGDGPGVQVNQVGTVVLIRPESEAVATRRVGARGQQYEGFYAS
jgi:hypothetical protein